MGGKIIPFPGAGRGTGGTMGDDVACTRHTWYMAPLPFDETLDDALRLWRQHGMASGHSDRTITSREGTVRRLRRSGILPLEATPEQLVEWLSELPLQRSSKATYRAQLRAFYAWLVRTGRRQDDPTENLPSLHISQGIPRPLTAEQVQAVLAACTDGRAAQTRAYFILAAYAGLRVHEIAKIRGEDFGAGEIMVNGKGGSRSSVPLHPTVAALAEYMPTAGWWFPSDAPSGHVHRCSVSAAIKRAMVRAKVPGTPHAARHYFGTRALWASGGDLRMAQRALRHKNVATTAIYTQVADDKLRAMIAKIA